MRAFEKSFRELRSRARRTELRKWFPNARVSILRPRFFVKFNERSRPLNPRLFRNRTYILSRSCDTCQTFRFPLLSFNFHLRFYSDYAVRFYAYNFASLHRLLRFRVSARLYFSYTVNDHTNCFASKLSVFPIYASLRRTVTIYAPR